MIVNRNTIREQNETIVLTAIINHPNTSRAAISHDSGLNKATVSEIVKKLLKEKLVVELGTGQSSVVGGRKPVLLKVNANGGYAMSLTITQTKISSLVCNLQGRIIAQYDLVRKVEASNIIDSIEEVVLYHRKSLNKTPFGFVGIVVSIDGFVHEDEIVASTNKMLEHLTAKHLESHTINCPISLENQNNLAVIAEAAFAQSPGYIISIELGEGIGSGILLKNRLFRSKNSLAGNLGHTILFPFGKHCDCGKQGCLNQYCSTAALVSEIRDLKKDSALQLEDLIALYKNGDEEAKSVVEHLVQHLSIAISNLVSLLDPEKIYLNGELFRALPECVNAIQTELDEMSTQNVPVTLSTLGKNAALLGGIALVLQQFFQVPQLELHLDD
ncbi:putative NBD/HSP70 family sugar kinase [Trichococcus patagoniensis]|uniref:Putative NBD/HSP70 family sugar kinase n=1 Tax=Trichococcus patagoniensis TaxID=382641 RepID=A0A2T5IPJ3_9LACT|nr:ROK family transcriptional regulator [Trichococcus patagoniensis]PTQ85745.1 putative NBD/HSP70 family sugar kinase [Trichococcus patagoniensis]